MVRNTRGVIVFTINVSVYCFVCELFAFKTFSHFVTKEGFSEWRNSIVIDHQEKTLLTETLS